MVSYISRSLSQRSIDEVLFLVGPGDVSVSGCVARYVIVNDDDGVTST